MRHAKNPKGLIGIQPMLECDLIECFQKRGILVKKLIIGWIVVVAVMVFVLRVWPWLRMPKDVRAAGCTIVEQNKALGRSRNMLNRLDEGICRVLG